MGEVPLYRQTGSKMLMSNHVSMTDSLVIFGLPSTTIPQLPNLNPQTSNPQVQWTLALLIEALLAQDNPIYYPPIKFTVR